MCGACGRQRLVRSNRPAKVMANVVNAGCRPGTSSRLSRGASVRLGSSAWRLGRGRAAGRAQGGGGDRGAGGHHEGLPVVPHREWLPVHDAVASAS